MFFHRFSFLNRDLDRKGLNSIVIEETAFSHLFHHKVIITYAHTRTQTHTHTHAHRHTHTHTLLAFKKSFLHSFVQSIIFVGDGHVRGLAEAFLVRTCHINPRDTKLHLTATESKLMVLTHHWLSTDSSLTQHWLTTDSALTHHWLSTDSALTQHWHSLITHHSLITDSLLTHHWLTHLLTDSPLTTHSLTIDSPSRLI